MDQATFIARYGEAVEQRRATVLVGAGLSFDGGYPSWKGLLKDLRDELGLNESFTDLPLLAQHVENTDGGRDRLISAVCKAIGSVDPKPAQNHRLLAQLPIDEIWTTNYDPLIEYASKSDFVVELDEQLIDADASTRRVYKMHGSIHPGATVPEGGIDKLVISRDDFDNYEQFHPRFWRLLQAQFLTRSFLFLGFSLSDPNFEAVLKLARLATPDRQMTHYAVLRREGADDVEFELRERDLAKAGVQVVAITEHDEIPDFLRRLVARTRPSRLFISGSEPNGKRDYDCTWDRQPYPSATEVSPKLQTIAKLLGRHLAAARIRVATANLLGAEVGYALLDELGQDYDPDRLMLIRRENQASIDPPNRRRGRILFVGDDPTSMRTKIYVQVRAAIVLAGGVGTRSEVDDTRSAGMGVVPLARTGGTAREVWQEMTADLGSFELGGRPIDPEMFAALNDANPTTAVEAAVALVRQAMFMPDDAAP